MPSNQNEYLQKQIEDMKNRFNSLESSFRKSERNNLKTAKSIERHEWELAALKKVIVSLLSSMDTRDFDKVETKFNQLYPQIEPERNPADHHNNNTRLIALAILKSAKERLESP